MKNIKKCGIRGEFYDLIVENGKLIAQKLTEKYQGDAHVIMDGDVITHSHKKYKCKLTERKDCSIKKIEFFAA